MTSSLKKFQECVEKVSYGAKIQRTNYLRQGKHPVVSQESALINGFWNEDSDVFLVDRPVIVFGDHTRALKYIDFNFVLGADGAKIIKPKNFVDSKFFYYFLMANPIEGKGYARHYRFLKELTLNVPPLSTQQKIVAKLDAIFTEIDKATAASEANAKNAEALFHSYLRKLINGDEFWSNVDLGSLCDVKTGKKDVNQGNVSGVYPFFTCAEKHTFSDVYSFDCEAILIAGNGAVGQTSYYNGKFEAYQRTYVLSNFKNVLPHYLLYILRGFLMSELSSKVLGNTIPYIKKGMLTDFLVPLPDVDTQRILVSKLDVASKGLEKTTKAYYEKVSNLVTLKNSILKQAFSGELVKV